MLLSNPLVLVLTDRRQVPSRSDLVEVVRTVAEGGATHVVLREKDLPTTERSMLAHSIAETLGENASEQLIVASDVDLAAAVGAAGVHLAASDTWPEEHQLIVGDRRLLVGRSCHSETELRAAEEHRADYATVSPVFPTFSKPGYGPALGMDELARLCRSVPSLPVVALGGLRLGRAASCLRAGAAGVAVMGEIMRSDDPGKLVALLASEVSE